MAVILDYSAHSLLIYKRWTFCAVCAKGFPSAHHPTRHPSQRDREGISPRIVMVLGSWSSDDAIEPSLAAPTEENIIDSMSNIAL